MCAPVVQDSSGVSLIKGDFVYQELFYDDGGPSDTWKISPAVSGYIGAVRFSLPFGWHLAEIDVAKFYIYNP